MDKVYINTDNLERSLLTLEKAYVMLQEHEENSIEYELYRNALVKGFEMTLEQSGKLLKKLLFQFSSSKKAIDSLSYKDLFRMALKHSLLEADAVERWFEYRDNRNDTAHDYGIALARETLELSPQFIEDVRALLTTIKKNSTNG